MEFSKQKEYQNVQPTGRPIPIEIEYKGKTYKGTGTPANDSCSSGVCFDLRITLNGNDLGMIHSNKNGEWKMDGIKDQELVNTIGEEILLWYE